MKVVAHQRFVSWRRALDPDLRLQVDTLVAYLARQSRSCRPDIPGCMSCAVALTMVRADPTYGFLLFDTDVATRPPTDQGVVLLGGDKTGNWSEFYSARVAEADLLYEQFTAARDARRRSTP